MIVVDASIALAWALEETAARDATAALDYVWAHGGCVPGNFPSEVAHGLLQAERHNRITPSDVSVALDQLRSLPLTVQLPDPQVIVATAREYRLTAYDAAYLALALERGLPLATMDGDLMKAARAAKIPQQQPKRR